MKEFSARRKEIIAANEELFINIHTEYLSDLSRGLDSFKTKIDGLVFSKKDLAQVFDYLGLRRRTKEEISKAKSIQPKRKEDSKIKEDYFKEVFENNPNLLKEYENGLSIVQLAKKINTTPYLLTNWLQNNNIELRSQYTYHDLIEDVNNSDNVSISDVRKWYLQDNLMNPEVKKLLSDAMGFEIPAKIFTNFLLALDIRKNRTQVRELQGLKSRKEKERNMGYLKLAGFDTIEELAEFYEKNTNYTPQGLVRLLNNNLEESSSVAVGFEFTSRWLARHMNPLVSKVRLGGVSRTELEFQTFVRSIYDGELYTSYRKLIAPREVDIYLPDLKLAIEFNGDYWHSDEFIMANHGMTAEAYHELKRSECAALGVELLFVWESAWYEDRDAVEAEVFSFIFRS